MSKQKPSTPCINLCGIDKETGFCAGCGRTREEIAGWGLMSEAEHQTIMQGLAARTDRESAKPGASPFSVQSV